jgi:hypothetical protein
MENNAFATSVCTIMQDPKSLRPVEYETRILFIGNAGSSVGLPPERIAQLCTVQEVVPKVDVPDPNKTFLYVTFATVALAKLAMQALLDTSSVGRQVTARFADVHPKAYRVSLSYPKVSFCV